MKNNAYETDGRGGLVLKERTVPALGERQVLLEMKAVSLNFRDIPFIRGSERRAPSLGRVPFSDGVGIVRAVGPGVERVKVGDRVSPSILPRWIDGPLNVEALSGSFGSDLRDGLLSEWVVVEDTALVHVPVYLSDIEAATLPCAALTAWHALAEARAIKRGEVVVIETTGGVALFAAQIAVAMGLKAIVTSRSEEKLERTRELGVWETLNSSEFSLWDEQVLALTDQRGAPTRARYGAQGRLTTILSCGVIRGYSRYHRRGRRLENHV